MNPAGFWWAAAPEELWPDDKELIGEIRSNFSGDHGDRHQQIVFIGQGIEQQRIENILDGCLLTESEFAQGPSAWADLEDPLPPIEFEDEDEG